MCTRAPASKGRERVGEEAVRRVARGTGPATDARPGRRMRRPYGVRGSHTDAPFHGSTGNAHRCAVPRDGYAVPPPSSVAALADAADLHLDRSLGERGRERLEGHCAFGQALDGPAVGAGEVRVRVLGVPVLGAEQLEAPDVVAQVGARAPPR